MRFARLLPVVLCALVANAVSAQEKIDNVEFAAWKKLKKGTSITMKMTSSFAGMASEVTTTSTLVEVADDKVLVETSGVSKTGGMEFPIPVDKRDVPKTLTIEKGVVRPDPATYKPEGTYEEGMETLKVAGVEYKTKWYKYKTDIAGSKTVATMWVCDEIPGSVVKMESTTTGAANITSKMEVVAFMKP